MAIEIDMLKKLVAMIKLLSQISTVIDEENE